MEKVILWEKEIEKDFAKASENELDDLLELVRFVQKNGIQNVICKSTLDKAELWEWLYSKEQIELNDIKRELSRRLEKAECKEEGEYEEFFGKIGKLLAIKVLLLSFKGESIYYISTIAEYYASLRNYLALEKKDDFCNDLQECFPNIFFVEEIETTVNTLNRKFEDMREEIIEHLVCINDYYRKFSDMLENHKSYREIAKQFIIDTGIDCSPQAGREKVQALKETRINEITGQEETVVCELHTKFKTFNIDKEKQDRIYFFPGKQGILGGRIIVKHIGTHL